ncbi:hypothetical protein [Paraburkholderia ferrariae]|jgi:hypothetical protein|uniref:hypothetical protein n=1 Tax=Paraburkholderia ferrariae TaxID=386056 RepID=UPI0005A8159B|nr:hypothetical protein [Paraburkholderia ferrariae]
MLAPLMRIRVTINIAIGVVVLRFQIGVHGPEDLYFGVWVAIELTVAILAYALIMYMWRRYCGMFKN